ncbi:MAG: HAD family hydrolase [Burkholderiaceae bacterium]
MALGIEAIIFDCDGTLVDSEVPGLDVLYEQATLLGVRMTRDEAHEEFRGKSMALCVEAIGQRLAQRPPNFDAEFTARVREATAARFREGLNPMPGALALVARLQRPYCIATNGPREKAELTLGLTGLLPWFENRIFCAYEVGLFKPAPGLFLHAAQAMGAAPEHCAVVEDSLPGIEAGLAAGMQVFSLCPPEIVRAEMARRIRAIRSLAELDEALHA